MRIPLSSGSSLSDKNKKTKNRPSSTVCFWLAPPAGLEPASICTQSVNALSAQVCLTEQRSVFRFAEAANIANPSSSGSSLSDKNKKTKNRPSSTVCFWLCMIDQIAISKNPHFICFSAAWTIIRVVTECQSFISQCPLLLAPIYSSNPCFFNFLI